MHACNIDQCVHESSEGNLEGKRMVSGEIWEAELNLGIQTVINLFKDNLREILGN